MLKLSTSVACGLAAGIVVVASLTAAGLGDESHAGGGVSTLDATQGAQGSDFVSASIDKGDKCAGQVDVDGIGALASMSSARVWMPSSKDASMESIDAMVMCGSSPTLYFTSGISVAFESGWKLDDPKQRWVDMADQWGGTTSTLLGEPAYVIDLGDKSDDPSVTQVEGAEPTSEVLVVVDDTLIRVIGPSIAADRLVAVVASIDTEAPVRG